MRVLFVAVLVLLSCAASGFASESVGTVKTVAGKALIERQGQLLVASVGVPVYAYDRLLTRGDGALGVILKDDTSVSLGPDSEMRISEYVFAPREGGFSVVLKMLKGTFLYMSGVIGKLAPEAIRLETPDSTIAVRGTRLLIKISS